MPTEPSRSVIRASCEECRGGESAGSETPVRVDRSDSVLSKD